MATEAPPAPQTAPASNPGANPAVPDDVADRAFLMSMARIPLIAVAWVGIAFAAHAAWAQLIPASTFPHNFGSLVVLAGGMLLAAWIDGYAFKVPNWLTLSIVVGAWYIAGLREFGINVDGGYGGIGQALLGTFIGFAALFPALFIGGMGQGDVKMTMGFGAWCGAFFGDGTNPLEIGGPAMIWWGFALGVIVGGIFGIVMMAIRRQFHKNASNFKAILGDLQTLVTHGPTKATERAQSRRADWVRLPYGVPLCVGFLGYLYFRLFEM
jgi:prepilin peptidase CpaA